jgi:hypothetical protein
MARSCGSTSDRPRHERIRSWTKRGDQPDKTLIESALADALAILIVRRVLRRLVVTSDHSARNGAAIDKGAMTEGCSEHAFGIDQVPTPSHPPRKHRRSGSTPRSGRGNFDRRISAILAQGPKWLDPATARPWHPRHEPCRSGHGPNLLSRHRLLVRCDPEVACSSESAALDETCQAIDLRTLASTRAHRSE